MGKVPCANPSAPVTHFSHPHTLYLIHSPIPSSTCSACNQKQSSSAALYACAPCNFFLHKNCFDLPKMITHPFHKQHALTLLPVPAYPDGLFHCDACSQTGTGLSYHCHPCGVDIHALCAAMPMSVAHAAHAHKLDLVFECPYLPKEYSCDICTKLGSGHWLYRCGPCGFDAHLNCARGAAAPHLRPQQQNVFANPMVNNAHAAAFGIPVGSPPLPFTSSPFLANRQGDQLAALQALQQMMNNNNAMMNEARFGGANYDAMQQLMQMMSSFNNNGGGGIPAGLNGFGGGGINPGLNGFGGGAPDLVHQALMNGGGGGGGLDFLQNIVGGGGGGLNELLGGILGGFSL